MGLALCFGTPGLIVGLLLSGAIPPGPARAEGLYQQLGYLFTGLVFLSTAWVWGRSGRVLREFKATPETQRASLVLRECLLYSVVIESSAFCGLAYWLLVGENGTRHVWGFLLLTPVLFLALVPRYSRWMKGLEV
jgi:hypothetical protein